MFYQYWQPKADACYQPGNHFQSFVSDSEKKKKKKSVKMRIRHFKEVLCLTISWPAVARSPGSLGNWLVILRLFFFSTDLTKEI